MDYYSGGKQDVVCLVFKARDLYKLVILNCELEQGDEPVLFKICVNLHRVVLISELLDEPLPSRKPMMTWSEFYHFLRSRYSEEEKLRIIARFKGEVSSAEIRRTEPNSHVDPAVEKMFLKAFRNNGYFETKGQ
jgi:hypothetical protein